VKLDFIRILGQAAQAVVTAAAAASRDLIDAAAALEHVTGESVVQRIDVASL